MHKCASCDASMQDERTVCPRCGTAVATAYTASSMIVAPGTTRSRESQRLSHSVPRPEKGQQKAAQRRAGINPLWVVVALLAAILVVLLLRRP
jgi:hypothetical protein